MSKLKKFVKTKDYIDENGKKHILMAYAELTKEPHLNGILVSDVSYRKGDGLVTDCKNTALISFNEASHSPIKTLNFGCAVCAPDDEFDPDKGTELCKARFSKTGLTTQDCRFFTDDMVNAILDNELHYLLENKVKPAIVKHPEASKQEVKAEEPQTEKEEELKSEAPAKKDGQILKITWKGEILKGFVSYAAFKSYDETTKNAEFYWVLDTKENNNETFYKNTVPFTTNVSSFKTVEFATHDEVRAAEALLKERFGRIWDWKKKEIRTEEPRTLFNNIMDYMLK